MTKLIYTGPLQECGIKSPVTGRTYTVRCGEPFTVDHDDDPQALVARYQGVLEVVARPKEPKDKRRGGHTEKADSE